MGNLNELALNVKERNCSKSFGLLLDEVDPLIRQIVRSYTLYGQDYEELRQKAIIGVWKALRTNEYHDVSGFVSLVTRRRLGEVWKQIKHDQRIGKTLFKNDEEYSILSKELTPLQSAIIKDEIEFARAHPIPVLPKIRKNKYIQKLTPWQTICNQPVRRKDNGKSFATLTLAARSIKRGNKSLLAAIKNGYTCGGTKWEWIKT